jgi:DNA-binding MarR family transcriptional regulator
MNSFGLQRRLDALSRDVGAIHSALDGVARRLDGLRSAPAGALDEAAVARGLLDTRRRRDEAFGAGLFSDPAWDMLLNLYAAEAEGQNLSMSQLCAVSRVPQTTAQRWIDCLAEAKVVVRGSDTRDARRTMISLSPEARDRIELLLRGTMAAFAPGAAD